MSKNLATLLHIFVLLLSGCVANVAIAAECSLPEVVEGEVVYNRLVCEGVSHLESGDYIKAIKILERASNERLFERPNFALYSRLAIVHFNVGNLDRAEELLNKAELSLSVLTGLLECKEIENGFELVSLSGSKVTSPHAMDVAKTMCGAAYEYLYRNRTLETIVENSELIKVFLDAKNTLTGNVQ